MHAFIKLFSISSTFKYFLSRALYSQVNWAVKKYYYTGNIAIMITHETGQKIT